MQLGIKSKTMLKMLFLEYYVFLLYYVLEEIKCWKAVHVKTLWSFSIVFQILPRHTGNLSGVRFEQQAVVHVNQTLAA